MRRHEIPHPDSEIFTDIEDVEAFIQSWSLPDLPAIKASGLADEKGVILPNSKEEAIRVVRRMMIDKEFGLAGEKIVIQERLAYWFRLGIISGLAMVIRDQIPEEWADMRPMITLLLRLCRKYKLKF